MLIAILGRQPELSIAELAAVFGETNVQQFTPSTATIDTTSMNISHVGGTQKVGSVLNTLSIPVSASDDRAFRLASDWIIKNYPKYLMTTDGKITLGISAYGFKINPRNVQKIGLILKSHLKKHAKSLRLIPNQTAELSTATSHNNKLGLSDKKRELILVRNAKQIIIAESLGAQNITAYAERDRGRPKRDAFVGMLPPKLAQMMINLAVGDQNTTDIHLLDPFCGTGTVLQEALLRGYTVSGTDLQPKMIDYTRENLDWILAKYHTSGKIHRLQVADAMTHTWPEAKNLTAIVCETYLGQPFSAPPRPEKLKEVVKNCDHIISSFLTNIHSQITADTTLCVAVPAWKDADGRLTHLPLTRQLEKLGYRKIITSPLLYHRPDQVVARQILLLKPLEDKNNPNQP